MKDVINVVWVDEDSEIVKNSIGFELDRKKVLGSEFLMLCQTYSDTRPWNFLSIPTKTILAKEIIGHIEINDPHSP